MGSQCGVLGHEVLQTPTGRGQPGAAACGPVCVGVVAAGREDPRGGGRSAASRRRPLELSADPVAGNGRSDSGAGSGAATHAAGKASEGVRLAFHAAPYDYPPVRSSPSQISLGQKEYAQISDAMLNDAASVVEEVDAVPTFNLPLLVRAVGAVLACSAGLINSVAYFELEWFVSHQTGNLSKVGFGSMEALYVLLSFVAGSVACGLFIAKDTVHIGLALYDFGLLSISVLLIAATFSHHNRYAKFFAAAACGLQNGMATFWGGAVVRTTHVTGLFTDVGLLIGRLASLMVRKRFGRRFDSIDKVEVVDGVRKLYFLGVLAASFLLGIIIGSYAHGIIHEYAFLVPATVVGILGIAYLIHRVFILKQKLFSDTEMELVDIAVHGIIEDDAVSQQASAEEGAAGRGRIFSSDDKRLMYTGRGRSFSAMSKGSHGEIGSPMRVVSEDRVRHVAAGVTAGGMMKAGSTMTLHSPGDDWVSVTRRCALQRQDTLRQGAHIRSPAISRELPSMSKELAENHHLQTVPE